MTALPTRPLNHAGHRLIEGIEHLELHSYPDPVSKGDPWTIGYGHTGPDVHPGMVCTEAQADHWFDADVAWACRAVNHLCPKATDNQFAAMVSLCFNLGASGFAQSKVCEFHRAGNYAKAQAAFVLYDHSRGHEVDGLKNRREAEAKLYGTP